MCWERFGLQWNLQKRFWNVWEGFRNILKMLNISETKRTTDRERDKKCEEMIRAEDKENEYKLDFGKYQ